MNYRIQLVAALLACMGFLLNNGIAFAQSKKRSDTPKTNDGFAVVELFTSQGCSSCPSADENLAMITKQAERDGRQIVTLSFHVDYWNSLGWKDPYSFAGATERQRRYAGVHGSAQVYTPQMVVNGTAELLGSSRDKSRTAIQTALKDRPSAGIKLTTQVSENEVMIGWDIQDLQNDDLLNVAIVQRAVEDRVDSGENAGRKLSHVNVVRDFHVLNMVKEHDSMTITLPQDLSARDLHVVAYLQSPMDAVIRAVATRDIVSE